MIARHDSTNLILHFYPPLRLVCASSIRSTSDAFRDLSLPFIPNPLSNMGLRVDASDVAATLFGTISPVLEAQNGHVLHHYAFTAELRL